MIYILSLYNNYNYINVYEVPQTDFFSESCIWKKNLSYIKNLANTVRSFGKAVRSGISMKPGWAGNGVNSSSECK